MNPSPTRRQLSLYVPREFAAAIEVVRRVVDPVQFGLIPAHVTLGREDEVENLSIAELPSRFEVERPLVLRFGSPEVFAGHGIFWNCLDGESEYQALRERVFGRSDLRRPRPHITLAHPRNPKASGNSLAATAALAEGTEILFDAVRLIEQEGRGPWHVLEEFPLGDTKRG